MEEIKNSIIQFKVKNSKCPSMSFCTVATTGYEKEKRERICLRCWLQFCEENNIKIDYKN